MFHPDDGWSGRTRLSRRSLLSQSVTSYVNKTTERERERERGGTDEDSYDASLRDTEEESVASARHGLSWLRDVTNAGRR